MGKIQLLVQFFLSLKNKELQIFTFILQMRTLLIV